MHELTTCWFDCTLVSRVNAVISGGQWLTAWIGFLHPIIHLGFGVEFKQPAIIAEALAEAAVHDNWIGMIP